MLFVASKKRTRAKNLLLFLAMLIGEKKYKLLMPMHGGGMEIFMLNMSNMSKSLRRVFTATAVTAAAAAAAGISAYVTTELWVRTALDREEPEIMKRTGSRIAGGMKNADFERKCMAASQMLAERAHETVKIAGGDGVGLTGHFYPCENAKRVIIAFHGWRSSWNYDYGLIADFWHENNCSVLYAEQRGQNNSGGEHMGFGLTERYDCAEWVNWAICRCGKNLPIYLAGISMGAATVLMASDLPMHENVCGIMADCGFTSPKAIWKHVARHNLHMIYGVRGAIADFMCKRKIRMSSEEYSATDALKRTKIPVLFVHGTDDRFVPVEMTYENYKACTSPKRLLIVPGADHAMSYYVNPHEYEKAVLEFWNDFDRRVDTQKWEEDISEK